MKWVRVIFVSVAVMISSVVPLGVSAWPSPCMASVMALTQARIDLWECAQEIGNCPAQEAAYARAKNFVELNCAFSM